MMKSGRAFSLVEVVLAVGLIAFVLVAILGVFPLGLDASRASINETRSGQLATTVFSTLRTPPFTAVSFFGQNPPFDLSTPDANSYFFYVEYADPNLPVITATQQPNSIYVLKLTFNSSGISVAKSSGTTYATFPKGQANEITLEIYPLNQPKAAQRFISTVAQY